MLLTGILNKIYADIEPVLLKRFIKQPVSCKEGCAYCCYQYVLITAADAINIAEEILTKWSDWKSTAQKMQIIAKEMTIPEMTTNAWFDLQIPCTFLDTEKNTCQIYPVRPAECRFYFAMTPPVLCSIANKGNRNIQRYDLTEAEDHIWNLSAQIQAERPEIIGPPPLIGAPLPLMVLYVMKQMFQKDKKRRRFIAQLLKGIPSPQEFMYNQIERILK